MTTPEPGVVAPESPLLSWWLNTVELRSCLSSDGQVYVRDPASSVEYRLETSATFGLYGELSDSVGSHGVVSGLREPEDGPLEIVRHLDRQERTCRDCGEHAEAVRFAWSDQRCPVCWSTRLDVIDLGAVPPRPPEFVNLGEPQRGWHNMMVEYGAHTWGADPNADARMLATLASTYRFADDQHSLYVLMLFGQSLLDCRPDDPSRYNLVLNVGNVADNYLRITGSQDVAGPMLDLFERAAAVDDDPVPRSMALHSFAIGVIYVLDFYEEAEAERITGRPGLRALTIGYLRESIALAETVRERDPEGTERQLGRIRYALADMLRRGRATRAELQEALDVFERLDSSTEPQLKTFMTATQLETRLDLLPEGDEDLAPWLEALNELQELIWGYDVLKLGHRWHWALSIGRFLCRLGAPQEARPYLQSAVTFARKDTPFDSDPVALTGDAERLFQAFNLLATHYVLIGWAFEGLALLETYRGRVLDVAALDDEGRVERRAEAEAVRESEFFGGMFGPNETPTLRLTEEMAWEERTGRRFGPFTGDYELPGLADRVDGLFGELGDEPTALISYAVDTASRHSGGWVVAVVIRPPGSADPRCQFARWQLDDDQLAALASSAHRRPGSFRAARLDSLGELMRTALIDPLSEALEGCGVTRALMVLPSAWSSLPLEAAADSSAAISRVGLLPALSFGSGLARPRRRSQERLLIVGYSGADLARAEAEADLLAGLFGSSVTYLRGADCTKRSIVEHLNSEYDFIHLICHGTYDAAHPLESSLYFSADLTDDSKRLRARELEILTRFPRYPVVTVSACSTALTAQSRSNTWNGLPGSLLRAGAHAIIGARWPVRDDAAEALMITFYRQLRETDAPVLSCFHLAQSRLRDTGARVEDWAGFGYLGLP